MPPVPRNGPNPLLVLSRLRAKIVSDKVETNWEGQISGFRDRRQADPFADFEVSLAADSEIRKMTPARTRRDS